MSSIRTAREASASYEAVGAASRRVRHRPHGCGALHGLAGRVASEGSARRSFDAGASTECGSFDAGAALECAPVGTAAPTDPATDGTGLVGLVGDALRSASGPAITTEEALAATGLLLDHLAAELVDGDAERSTGTTTAGAPERPGGEPTSASTLLTSVDELERLQRRCAAERLRRVAALDERQVCLEHGASSTAGLLADRGQISFGQAKRDVAAAAKLEFLPRTASALAAGDLERRHLDVAVRATKELGCDPALSKDPEAHRRVRAELDDLIAEHGAGELPHELSRRVADWHAQRSTDSQEAKEARAHARRWLRLAAAQGPDGMARLSGELDPVTAAHVRALLDSLGRRDGEDDERDLGQRQADALASAAKQLLDAGQLPEVAVQRPHVMLITSLEALEGLEGALASELDGYGPVGSATARELFCDADITPVLKGRNGEILDIGRTERRPTRRQRQAVIARDRRCVGCGAPASRCQIHHVKWWRHGGPTDLDNLVLVCASCHHGIHHRGWTVERDGEAYRVDRPRGRRGRGRGAPPGGPPRGAGGEGPPPDGAPAHDRCRR